MTFIYNRESEKARRRQLRKQMPPAEVLLWDRLRNKQLLGVKFRRQFSVGAYVLDFYAPQLKLAIETDGESHYTAQGANHDERRGLYLDSLGILTIRFTNPDIYDNLDGVLEKIAETIRTRLEQKI